MMLRQNTLDTESGVDAVIDTMREAVREALEQLGDDVIADIDEMESVPVEVRAGPRGGRIIIRSQPGESPRRETGELISSNRKEVTGDGDAETLVVYSTAPYAAFLEFGTEKMRPRPAYSTAYTRFYPLVPQRLISAITEAFR